MKPLSAFSYLFVAVVITGFCLIIYAAVQQSYRTAANDPQIQTVDEIRLNLINGKSINRYFRDTVDLKNSLSDFVILFDKNGSPLRSSGLLNNQMLHIPAGVFSGIKMGEQKEVTTMPESDVRLAMVIAKVNDPHISFVASGRSLREVESREEALLKMIFAGWILLQSFLILYIIVVGLIRYKNNQNELISTVA